MSTLSGQTIQSTYQGLIKLSDSTTGITQSLQSVTDGLGNDTGSRIGQNAFTAPNIMNTYTTNPSYFKPDYGGIPFGGVGYNPGANQNRTIYTYMYDTGINSYSAITYNCDVATSTSDVVELSFYTLQFVPEYGAVPKDLIMSGITLISNSSGMKTTTLPSTLSFSGYGGGYYGVVLYITNAGNVTPTVRYRSSLATQEVGNIAFSLGLVKSANGIQINLANRVLSFNQSQSYLLNTAPLSSFTESDIINNWNTTGLSARLGFGLDVIK